MFSIGEKIVYPMHGAGVIEAIEEKKILGEAQKYYVLKIPVTEMKLMVPVKTAAAIGVRPIISDKEVKQVYDSIKERDDVFNSNWNKRYRDNIKKIKTGNILEVASVVKSLMHREQERTLSTSEKKMLTNAKEILISELVLVTNHSKQAIEDTIDHLVAQGE